MPETVWTESGGGATVPAAVPGRLSSANDFNLKILLLNIRGVDLYESANHAVVRSREFYDEVERWVEGYEEAQRYPGEGWSIFADDWRRVRLFVPLQFRLVVEQICYDKGLPWRKLVSGFAPLKEAASALQATG